MQTPDIGAPPMFVLDRFAVYGHTGATAGADRRSAADQHHSPTVAHDP